MTLKQNTFRQKKPKKTCKKLFSVFQTFLLNKTQEKIRKKALKMNAIILWWISSV
jgi:hypothetical protein